MINTNKLFSIYDELQGFLSANGINNQDFEKVKVAFEEKRQTPDLHIMVYGIYNAGKSTLINALIGQEVAKVDDIPLTDSVTAYQWGRYSLKDTPGVDAPIEHEKVAKQELLKADVVILVVNPSGAAEEKETLSILLDLIESKKKVFLVFNAKDDFPPEDLIKLKNATMARIQDLASERNISDLLQKIPMYDVNARRALNAKLKNSTALLEKSNFIAFQENLEQFLQNISPKEQYQRLQKLLLDYLESLLAELTQNSCDEAIVRYDQLLKKTESEKESCRRSLFAFIDKSREHIYERSRSILFFGEEGFQSAIENLIEHENLSIEDKCNSQLEFFKEQIGHEVSELIISTPEDTRFVLPGLDLSSVPSDSNEAPPSSQGGTAIPTDMLVAGVTQLTKEIKAEHIVGVLKGVKSLLPSLMKGVGAKTMEKMAGQFLTKWVPYVGTAITVALSLKDIFSEDPEQAEYKRQAEEQRKQQERYEKHVEDTALKLSEEFASAMRKSVLEKINVVFTDISEDISVMRNNFDEKDRLNSQLIEQVSVLYSQAEIFEVEEL